MKKIGLLLVAQMALAFPAGLSAANDNAGNVHWACHVKTQSGEDGLAMVDVKELSRAKKSALNARALTEKGAWQKSASIVECVQMPGGSFRDEKFKDFHSKVLM